MENIVIDILPGKDVPVCHASKGDVGRVIQLKLMDGYIPFDLSGYDTLVLDMKKPDTNIVTIPVTYDSNTSIISITTTEQMCSCQGRCLCEIKISNQDVKVGTLNFILEVEDGPGKDIVSVSEIYDLEQRIRDVIKKWRS